MIERHRRWEDIMAKQPDQDWRAWVVGSLPKMVATTEPAATGFQPGPTTEAVAPTPLPAGIHTAPSFDVIELLSSSERAQDRLRKLRLRKADAHRLIPEFETIRSASMARIEAESAKFWPGFAGDRPARRRRKKASRQDGRRLSKVARVASG
jgi:hypothetical protein